MINKLKKIGAYLLLRFQDAAAWRALFILAGGSGSLFAQGGPSGLFAPDKAEAWISIAMIGAGLIGLLLPEDVSAEGRAEAGKEAQAKANE